MPLLTTPPTVTVTAPVKAPAGTNTVIEFIPQFVAVAVVPLKLTDPVVPNPVPVNVTDTPAEPTVGESELSEGITVNANPLLV
jgi:hypothetical protein